LTILSGSFASSPLPSPCRLFRLFVLFHSSRPEQEFDRSPFDAALDAIQRMNDIQIRYHWPPARLQRGQKNQLELAYSDLHRNFSDIREFYEAFMDLTSGGFPPSLLRK
jgi:hypothetical protein